jgi:N-methylhydantoinase B
MLDNMIGSSGATPFRDGTFANGQWWIPEGQGPNVEAYERDWPILYLYRREHPNSAGAGKFRGGNGGILAYLPYKGTVGVGVYSAEGIPKSSGILGGSPGSRGDTTLVKNSNIWEVLKSGRLVESVDELEGERPELPGKGPALMLGEADVLEWNWGSCAGYGDPLDRDPERVRQDVAWGTITKELAESVYGVVLTETLEVDPRKTASLRIDIRRKRLEEAGAPIPPDLEARVQAGFPLPEDAFTIGDTFFYDNRSGITIVRCTHCGEVLAMDGQHYKEHVPMREGDIGDITKKINLARFVDQEVVYREYFCPGCALLLATEIARKGDERFHDILIDTSFV